MTEPVTIDTTGIFLNNAKPYWERGLSVIPVHPTTKRPIPMKWQQYADHLPTLAEQEHWLASYPNANIGLVLGQQSGLAMIDVDTDDERIKGIIQEVLTGWPSPWIRIGSKGFMLAYKWNGTKTFRLREVESQKTLVEHLSHGTQVVIPPSIHPNTGRPYYANTSLLDVYDELVPLPTEIEAMLRGALEEEVGIKLSMSGHTRTIDFISSGSRDNAMTGTAGVYARAIWRGEITVKEGIQMMQSWCEDRVERVAGDDVDARKGVERMLHFLTRDVIEKRKPLPKNWDEGLTEEEKQQYNLRFDVEHEQWDVDRLKEYLRQEFERYPEPESVGAMNAVSHVLDRLSRTQMDDLDEERVLRYMIDVGRLKVSVSTVRKRLKSLRAGEVQGLDHTELAKAVLDDMSTYGEVRFHNAFFWQWRGSHWEKMEDNEIKAHIANEYGHLPMARRSSDHKGIVEIMRSLCGKELRQLDMPGINFANGYLTIEMKLEQHCPDYGCTYTLPYRYIPEKAGKQRQFENFLHQVWGEDEDYGDKVRALQEAICVTLFGQGTAFQRAVLLYGVAHSGKSQLLHIVEELMPERSRSAVPPDQWSEKFVVAQLDNKLINVAGELSENRNIDGTKFKQIIVGEPLQVQHKNKDPFVMKPVAAHWFATNHLPKTTDTSDGFNRRWLVLTFNKKVGGEEKVMNIGAEIVRQEREEIVAWAVEAMPRLMLQKDYTQPPSHKDALEYIAQGNNSVRFFIRQSGMVRIRPSGEKTLVRTSVEDLYNAYTDFRLSLGGVQAVPFFQFSTRIKSLSVEFGLRMYVEEAQNGRKVSMVDGIEVVDPKRRAA